MKKINILIAFIFLISCSKETKNMLVTTKIKDFKKGKVYLQKVIKDTLIVNVDSIIIDGQSEFTLTDNVISPEIYMLSIDGTDKILQFFAEKGTINITTNYKNFNYKAKIEGSKNQELLDKFNRSMRKFNDLRLDLIKEKFDAIIAKNKNDIPIIEQKIANIDKRKLRYVLNFVKNNANYQIAPYLMLSELYNVKKLYLDTLTNSFSKEVKDSKYGKQLVAYIKNIK